MTSDFVDSNVLVYAFTDDARATAAQALLERGCAISVQGLNEFANVARRKLGKSWREIRDDLAAIRAVCEIVIPIDVDMHEAALRFAERYGFAIFDALMIAAALQAGSTTLWSEDMEHGMLIDGTLRIVNPFRAG
jgi:predicted nucleic acid-binding protein